MTDKSADQRIKELEFEIHRLNKVTKVLMDRVERSMQTGGDSYSLFESNILLQKTIDERTSELKAEVKERKRAEKQLRKSSQKLFLHIQQTPLGVIEWDVDFRVVEWNRAAERMFGFSRDDAVGRQAMDLIIPDDAKKQLKDDFDKLLTNRGGTRNLNKNIHKNGRGLICDWYNTPLISDEGEVVGVASLVQDVTERINNDREEKERLERVQRQRVAIGRMTVDEVITSGDFERATRMILEIVSEAIDVERVSLWFFKKDFSELACFDIYESSKNEHSAGAVLKQSDFPNYFEAVVSDRVISCDNARTDSRSREFTESYLIPHGITSMLDIAFRVSGNLVGVVCNEHTGEMRIWRSDEKAFADEISSLLSQVYLNAERKRSDRQKRELQERLERAERMESLGILAGGVAHDLNNILGPVVGYADLILRQVDENDRMAERVRRIGRSAQDAADVIQDLLTLARRGRYDMVPMDLNQIVRDFIESPAFVNLTNQRPEIEVTVNLADTTCMLQGSASHLSKVIMNLIINAFDAIQDEGRVVITTARQHVERLSNGFELGEASGNYTSLSVMDTGEGIETIYLDKIFEPYFSKKKMGWSSGSGLGLSVVYGVVKDHRGFYDVISSPGEGTDFRVLFPIADAAESERRPESGEIGGTESILIVDDDAGQRDVAADLIASLGYSVVSVASGEEAIEYLKRNNVDLVLLDMIMEPGIDGLDTYREIIKLHPGQKAIIASGFSATSRVEEMQRLGAGQYLRKPYSLTVLGQSIREELSKVSKPIEALNGLSL